MAKEATVRARIEPQLKENAEGILKKLGLNPTTAITIFYNQIALRHGLPFEVEIPNATTRRTFAATDRGEGLTRCKDAEYMFQKLGS